MVERPRRQRKPILTDEERRARQRERSRAYYQRHRQQIYEQRKLARAASSGNGGEEDLPVQADTQESDVSVPSSPAPNTPKTSVEMKMSWIEAFEAANKTCKLDHN
ncbi:hypothetical protein ACHHYP_20075 [Achlya hypogyna]|uniref:Uncharacterized protein n=1 Tax=Achlya hypogyna TaxID=1202772 RepID=A0A1V9ZT08_ACHHY|nr:hypothetical protein ACHHYP_20075 [Achlya hypogyna]